MLGPIYVYCMIHSQDDVLLILYMNFFSQHVTPFYFLVCWFSLKPNDYVHM